jgi:hypothetical protein
LVTQTNELELEGLKEEGRQTIWVIEELIWISTIKIGYTEHADFNCDQNYATLFLSIL